MAKANSKKENRAADRKAVTPFGFKFMWFVTCLFFIVIFFKQVKPAIKSDKKEETSNRFSLAAFSDGSYQRGYESKIQASPFISNLKKYKNQFDYTVLKKVNLSECYMGKEQYIFGSSMTKSFFGDDYIGDDAIKTEVKKLKFVQRELDTLGIKLLLLLAPGKSTYYTELLPAGVLKTKRKKRNYETYAAECKSEGVNCIDFIRYFLALKLTTKYPLFSQFGSHWSYYGECLAVDTTIKRMEKLMQCNLPSIIYTDVQLQDTAALVRDADILLKTPMLKPPKGKALAYPQTISYEQGEDIKAQKIIGIGDSYFRGFFYLGAMEYAFDHSKQWYYYNSIVPESVDNPEVWELDLKQEILKTKGIVILCNETNLKTIGNGFIDDAYLLFSDPDTYYKRKKEKDKINKFKKEIRKDKAQLAKLTRDAHYRAITLDSLITETASKRANAN